MAFGVGCCLSLHVLIKDTPQYLCFYDTISSPVSKCSSKEKAETQTDISVNQLRFTPTNSQKALLLFPFDFLPRWCCSSAVLYETQPGPQWKRERETGGGQRARVCPEIRQLLRLAGETHLPGTKRRRWSGDIEPGIAEVPPAAPEPRSNLQEFLHRRSSWRTPESTWGKETKGTSFLLSVFQGLLPA